MTTIKETVTLNEIATNLETYKGKKLYLQGYVSQVALGDKRNSTEKYLSCKFGDATGTVGAKFWDHKFSVAIFEQLQERGKKSACADVEFTVGEWQGAVDLKIDSIKLDFSRRVSDFSEKTKSDPKEMYNELLELIDSVQKSSFKQLLEGIFLQTYEYPTEEVKKKCNKIRNDFLLSAAATGHHHNYIHGLLEHSVNVVKTALLYADLYSKYYELDRALIITAGLLHDVGKIYEYTYEEGIEYSDEGPFVYHTVSGSLLVSDLVRELGIEMERMDLIKIIHILTSHHGEYSEHGPNAFCAEAHIMAIADNADSQANKAVRAFAGGNPKKMRSRFS